MNIRNRYWSFLDLIAVVAFFGAAVCLTWTPKLDSVVAGVTKITQPVQVSIDAHGVPVVDATNLMTQIKLDGRVSIIIRNQPHGRVPVVNIIDLSRCLISVQSNDHIITALDPNQKRSNNLDVRFILKGKGKRTNGGMVLGNQNLKIGTPVELEGENFRINGMVSHLIAQDN
uniref:DUF4330 domain-containing protein n=1 Tax=Paulinella chromatophora TaxID=39717 RepID=B1X3T2_PAUCH|nr:hypothetical protein PCC_0150 [Paulinella chromatophora]ACB42601.1 hypothetical protein PCC_0150 [Paulinella chromatophora]